MQTSPEHVVTAADLKARLEDLQRERTLAGLHGLAGVPAYMADLDTEVAATRAAYVGTAVTEIASLRAALDGPLVG